MPNVVVIGLGPAGLGAGVRLEDLSQEQKEFTDWVAVDQAEGAGGLSRSFDRGHGIFWDVGGHVLFSHYDYFDKAVEKVESSIPFGIVSRNCKVIYREGKLIADYPIQNHLDQLPPEFSEGNPNATNPAGESEAPAKPEAGSSVQKKRETMRDFGLRMFGTGLYNLFFEPYNRKVWAHDLEIMSSDWVAERVALPQSKSGASWGPNRSFRYPTTGGIGSLYTAICQASLPKEKLRFGKKIVKVSGKNHTVEMDDGSTMKYEHLISTMQLEKLLDMLVDIEEEDKQFLESTLRPVLRHSSTKIVGIAFRGTAKPEWHWAYFPESDCPYYRCMSLSNMVEHEEDLVQLQFEISDSTTKAGTECKGRTLQGDELIEEVIAGAIRYGLIPSKDVEFVDKFYHREEYGYPIPTLGLKAAVVAAAELLMTKYNIYSRGRFGMWLYEFGNMDHSFMQGVDAVTQIVKGDKGEFFQWPAIIGSLPQALP